MRADDPKTLIPRVVVNNNYFVRGSGGAHDRIQAIPNAVHAVIAWYET